MRLWPILILFLFIPTSIASEVCDETCVIIHPGPNEPYVTGVEFTRFAATVDIQGSIAITRLALTLENVDDAHHSYTAILPVMPGAAILALNLTTDTEFLEGEAKEAEQAQQEYEAAEQGERTALLLRHGGDHVQVRASIPAGETQLLQLSFVQTVDVRADSWYYVLPISRANADFIRLDVQTDSMLTSFPGLPMHVERENGTTAWLESTESVGDLRVRTPTGVAQWQVSAYQGEESFLVSLRFEGGDVYPRDLAMVLDKSGSMSGTKILDARESLVNLLPLLPADDQFAVWGFNSIVDAFTEGWLEPTSTNVEETQATVELVTAGGGTNIYEALETALQAMPGDGLGTVLFLTDGLPSAGITNHDDIVDMVKREAGDTVIHTVAIGLDADRTFLEDLSLATGGSLTVLRGDEALEERLAALYATLHAPVLRNLELTLPAGTSRVFPDPLPVYHDDAVLHIVGKGTLPAQWELGVRADTPSGVLTASIPVSTAITVAEVDWIWGSAQVEAWLAQERVEKSNLEAEITELALQYGIITPYTSWIAAAQQQTSEDMAYATSRTSASSSSTNGGAHPASDTELVTDRGTGGGSQPDKQDEEASQESPFPMLLPLLAMLWFVRRKRS